MLHLAGLFALIAAVIAEGEALLAAPGAGGSVRTAWAFGLAPLLYCVAFGALPLFLTSLMTPRHCLVFWLVLGASGLAVCAVGMTGEAPPERIAERLGEGVLVVATVSGALVGIVVRARLFPARVLFP